MCGVHSPVCTSRGQKRALALLTVFPVPEAGLLLQPGA